MRKKGGLLNAMKQEAVLCDDNAPSEKSFIELLMSFPPPKKVYMSTKQYGSLKEYYEKQKKRKHKRPN